MVLPPIDILLTPILSNTGLTTLPVLAILTALIPDKSLLAIPNGTAN